MSQGMKQTMHCMVFTYHPYMINHKDTRSSLQSPCYSPPDDENIAAHYNDYHHRNLAYVPANACLLLSAIVVNAAAAKVLYQEYILEFWVFEIGRYNGFLGHLYYYLLLATLCIFSMFSRQSSPFK